MFCDFLARSSGGGAKPSGLASGLDAGSASPRLSMLSSSASWKARWSSTSPPPPKSPNKLDGISTCEAILPVREVTRSRHWCKECSMFSREVSCDARVFCARRSGELSCRPASARALVPAAGGAGGGGRGADCNEGMRRSFRPPYLPDPTVSYFAHRTCC